MIYYMFALTPRKEFQKEADEVLIYIRDSEPYVRAWVNGLIGRLIKKEPNRIYKEPYKAFGRVEQNEILIICDYNWRQIK